MYLDFFSFERPPFRITPDPSLFYPGDEQGRGVVLDALIYGITSGEGILKVVGEVGSGKTMLCRMLEERLPEAVEIVYLANPSLTARDIVYAISFDLKLPVTPETDRLIVMQKLQEYLVDKHSKGGTVVVFIEEAQSMPLETLEEIRLLSNLETRQNKLMQIVLFGQPELDKILQQKSIRQLKERITHSFNLQPLSIEATRDYLRFRLRAAGCPWPQLFNPRAEKMLARASSGLTRRINILADKSLLAAYADSSIRQDARDSKGQIQAMVLPRHVRTAIRDSGYQDMSGLLRPILIGAGVVVLLTSAVLLSRFWWKESGSAGAGDDGATVRAQAPANAQVFRSLESEQMLTSEPAVPEETSRQQNPEAAGRVTGDAAQSPDLSDERAAITAAESRAEGDIESAREDVVERASENPLPEKEIAADSVAQGIEGTSIEASPSEVRETMLSSPEAGFREASGKQDVLQPGEDFLPDQAGIVTVAEDAPTEQQELAPVPEAGGTALPEGLIAERMRATGEWLQTMPDQGYTVQLLSVSNSQDFVLQDFLEMMESHELLDRSYICSLSVNEANVPDRLVIYGEFPGLSLARQFINSLPDEVAQYAPFVRNLNDISCINQP